jgi:arylsulfatase A-like enzyme
VKIIIILFCLSLFSCLQGLDKNKKELPLPNIIIILADDMGYSDIGCMGGEISTPSLDRLANNGLLFTQCYNASRCVPSRASLLTGLYQHKTGLGHMVADLGHPAYQGYLNNQCVTLAELLQSAGYSTIMAGKWHLGDRPEHWPMKRGFDHFYGIPAGGGLYFYPSKFLDRPIYRNNTEDKPDSLTFYSTDNFTTEAIDFITKNKSENKPFFLYLAYIAPHYPLQAWQEDIEKYEETYRAGYEDIRQKRFARQKELGVVSPEAILSPSEYSDWSDQNIPEESLKMTVYAAMVDRMDQNIGRLVKHLESSGELENTLILFLSDNGACAENVNRSPGANIGTVSSFVSYGQNWANVGNTPFRKYKSQEHEGGIITPLIAHWPGGIKETKRKVKDLVHIIDIVPTCLEIAGIKYPEQFKENSLLPLDGNSFLSILKNEEPARSRVLYWEHQGNKAIRAGNNKLVKSHNQPWELFNLDNDPTELNNLTSQKQEMKDSLEILWNKWAKEYSVLEWPLK